MHKMDPPYNPGLAADDDTQHFDMDIPDEPLAAANGAAADATRDPLLGHRKLGKDLLEIRKESVEAYHLVFPLSGTYSINLCYFSPNRSLAALLTLLLVG